MTQSQSDPTKKISPYDLSAVAELQNKYDHDESFTPHTRQPYDSKRSVSAYDLSTRPDNKSNSLR